MPQKFKSAPFQDQAAPDCIFHSRSATVAKEEIRIPITKNYKHRIECKEEDRKRGIFCRCIFVVA